MGECQTTPVLFELHNQCGPMGAVFRDRHKANDFDLLLTNMRHLVSDKGAKTIPAPLAVVGFLVDFM